MAPEMTVLAGPNGAGKSTLLPGLVLPRDMVTVLTDEIAARYMMEGYAPGVAIVLAGKEAVRLIRELLSQRRSFLHETNLAGSFHARLQPDLDKLGYQSNLLFVALDDPGLAVSRVARRVRRGGHHVPEHVIRARWKRGLRLFFTKYQHLADSWSFYDNSHGSVLVATGSNSSSPTIVRRDIWQMYQALAAPG